LLPFTTTRSAEGPGEDQPDVTAGGELDGFLLLSIGLVQADWKLSARRKVIMNGRRLTGHRALRGGNLDKADKPFTIPIHKIFFVPKQSNNFFAVTNKSLGADELLDNA
jgi:hypothetical protein